MKTPPAARLALVLLSCVVWMLYTCADGLTDLSGSTNSGPTCDNGWTLHGSHCYKKAGTTNGWQGARYDCALEGGDLVSITDETVEDFVKRQMGDKPFWIGLSNLDCTKEWCWFFEAGEKELTWSNTSMTPDYTNWAWAQKGSSNVESCAYVNQGVARGEPGKWRHGSCGSSLAYMCERPLDACSNGRTCSHKASASIYYRQETSFCDSGEFLYKDSCYHFEGTRKTWQEAEDFCKNKGGHLASLHSLVDGQFLYVHARGDYNWLGLKRNNGKYEWSDRSTTNDVLWGSGDRYDDCAQLRPRGYVHVYSCSVHWQLICQKGKARDSFEFRLAPTSESGPIIPEPTCNAKVGWTLHGSHCYKKMAPTNGWLGARYDCLWEGGDLVSITSKDEEDFVKSHMGNEPFWIGLSNLKCDEDWCWFFEAGEKELTWSNTSMTPDYTNWDPRQKGSSNVESCAYVNQGVDLYNQPGKWRHGSCGSSLAYMCKWSPDDRPDGWPCSYKNLGYRYNRVETSFCDSGEFLYKDSCYHFEGTRKTWQAAENFCKNKGGHLASLHSLVGGQFLFAHVRRDGQGWLPWLGLKKNNGNFEWSDRSCPDDVPWYNSYRSSECSKLAFDGKAHLTQCDTLRPSICQKGKARDSLPLLPAPTSTSGKSAKCGWWQENAANDFCYLIDSKPTKTWEEARDKCARLSGNLLGIADSQEHAFVQGLLPKASSVWLDTTVEDGSEQSAQSSPNSVQSAAADNPGDPSGRRCNSLLGGEGGREVGDCEKKRGYVCKRRVIQTCDRTKGWRRFRSNCYKKMETTNGWLGARYDCVSEGGDLVSIVSPYEEIFVKKQMGDKPFWIGRSNLNCNETWCQFFQAGEKKLTKSDTAVMPTYANWYSGHDGSADVASCAYVNQGVHLSSRPGKWRHGSCGSSLAYMCKRSPDACPEGRLCSYKDYGLGVSRVETSFCDSGEFLYKDSCYHFEGKERTWKEAEKFCQDWKGQLTSVHSLVDGQFLAAHAPYVGGSQSWVGLRKNTDEFEWSDATPAGKIEWVPHRPAGRGDCAALSQTGQLEDWPCTDARPFICKKAKVQDFLPPPPGWSLKCGWWRDRPFSDFCYLIQRKPTKTWEEARDDCLHRGGDLLSITDLHEHAFIQGIYTSLPSATSLWLGVNNNVTKDGSGWTDGSPLGYIVMDGGDPGDLSAASCLSLLTSNGRWKFDDCQKKRGYMCKKRGIPEPPQQPHDALIDPKASCDPKNGWNPHASNCYKKVETHNGWLGARQDCLWEGGDLVSITSKDEESFVKKQMGDKPFWIGLSNLDCNKDWCQFFEEGEKKLTWSDTGVTPAYANRDSRQDGSSNLQSCAYVNQGVHSSNQPGKWRYGSCGSSLPYMCKRSPDACPEGQLCSYKDYGLGYHRVETSYCDPGDFLYKGSCYHFGRMERTWKEAEKFCQESKGHLASVLSWDEGKFLAAQAPYAGGYQPWVGLKKNKGNFEWSDATPTGKIEWVPDRPAGRGDCASLSQTGKLEDRPCTNARPFICKAAKVRDFLLPPPPGRSEKCGWWQHRPFSDFCYLIQRRPTKAWKEARDDCLRRGGDLLSIADSQEHTFIQGIYTSLPSAPSLWLGVNNKVTKDGSGWTDGSPFGYIVMDGGDPGDLSAASCLSLLTSNGRWKFDDCQKKSGYICKKSGNTAKAPRPHDGFKEILVCNKHSADLVCEAEGQKQSRISIQSAFYSRRSADVCQEEGDSYNDYSLDDDDSSEDETTCSVEGILPRYRKLCNGQQKCHIEVLEDKSCPATSKYLQMVYSCEQKVCFDSLGIADGSVADSSFKASSSMEDATPEKARLNGESCWKPSKNALDSWILVNLGYTRKVTAIVTQGCNSTDTRSWDIPLEMRLSVNRRQWTKHPDGKFIGGVTHLLETPAFAQYVLILPLENRPEFGLRFDILGCAHEDETTCARKFNSVRFTDSMTFYCPPGCAKYFVAGTLVYSADSHICAAAIHAGVIENNIGGDCIVMSTPRQHVYLGSTRNRITSGHLNNPLGVSYTFADGEPRCSAPDWVEFAGFCYKLFDDKMEWSDAHLVCRGFGAELVSIRTEVEQAWVKSVSHLETSDMWTGLNDLALPGTLVWSDRHQVTFTHWAAGEPIHRVGLDQHCVAVLRQTGRWKPMSCAQVNSFMCKMPIAHFPIASPQPLVAP
ncbi:macrophage mannose receptor 1-like [Syngnathus typhle]|uniref:macrophage mannose receptor 1-like n=1 Tax=Syngnathus typhle TaxID=161592 RepID=UPI002A69A1DB|nr:macrophage mannose receptor 1-like [Syngnathus typhle]